MPKVKFDVSASDPSKAVSSGQRQSPRPGLYVAEILEANLKNGRDGTGEPDPERPQLEMVYSMTKAEKEKNSKYEGSRVWSYVMLPGHPSFDRTVWKLDQLLLATGLATAKKRKGMFDPEDLIGEEVVVNIRPDTNLNGEYRGQVGAVMAYDEETFGQESDEDEDEDLEDEDLEETEDEEEEEEEEEDEDEEDDEEEEEEDDDEEEAEDYSDWSIGDLRAELKERELSSRGTKPTLIERLEEDDANEGEEDEEDEEEEEEPTPRKRKSAAKKPAAKAKSTAKRSGGRRGKSGDYPFDDE